MRPFDAFTGKTGLRRLNALAGLAHLVDAVVLLALTFSQSPQCSPLYIPYLSRDGNTNLAVFSYSAAGIFCPRVAAITFAFMAMVNHLCTYVWFEEYYKKYIQERRVQLIVWIEYAFSATLMVVTIAVLSGILDLNALIPISAANVAMIVSGYVAEVLDMPKPSGTGGSGNSRRMMMMEGGSSESKQTEKRSYWKVAFWLGALIGLGPWISILISFFGSVTKAVNVAMSPVVYLIIFGEMWWFFCFAVVFYFQHARLFPDSFSKGASALDGAAMTKPSMVEVSPATGVAKKKSERESTELDVYVHGCKWFVLCSFTAKIWLTWTVYAAPVVHSPLKF